MHRAHKSRAVARCRYWDRVRKHVPDAMEPLFPTKAVASSRFVPDAEAKTSRHGKGDDSDGDDDSGDEAEANGGADGKEASDIVADITAKLAEKVEPTPLAEWLIEKVPDAQVGSVLRLSLVVPMWWDVLSVCFVWVAETHHHVHARASNAR